MRAAVIVVLLVCCCIGNGNGTQPKLCEKPVIKEHVSVSPDSGIVFNGVFYRQTGEYQNSVTSLIKRDINSWEIYTDSRTRNPDTLVMKDGTFFQYKKDNNKKVLFIELKKKREATQTGGPMAGGHEGSPINYVFNPENRILRGNIHFPLDENLILVCGFNQERLGDGEIGQLWYIYGVSDFPKSIFDAEVLGVDEDGTVHVFVYCTYITVPVGESQPVEWSFQETVEKSMYVVVVTFTIYNHGFLSLENIVAE